MRGSFDEEGYLDDGDLPSLTPKGSNSIGSHNQDIMVNELKETKRLTVSYKKGLKNKTDANGRQFWDQLDDESVDEGPNGSTTNNSGNHAANFDNGARMHYDDDGPDDEMAARRSVVITPPDIGPLKRTDTDNSAPTDNESHLTDEFIEEEQYETSFCGQTLNAIEDMCGGTLNVGESKQNNGRRSSTTSPPMDRKRRSPNYPLSADNSRSPRRDYPPISELQQENTAIEVEYMEPIRKTTSVGSDGSAPPEIKKKTIRLNAIAKKAKEKFRNKKGKSSTQSIGSEQSNDHQGPTSQQEIGSAVDDASTEATSASLFAGTTTAAASDAGVNNVANLTRNLDATEQVDTDYNSFNAAEKRKFIKLINSGVVATTATRQVLEERTKFVEPVNEVDDDIVVNDENEMDNLDTVMEGVYVPDVQPLPATEPIVDISTSSTGTAPFKKSGSIYYDAVRRNVNENDESTEIPNVEDVSHTGRPPSGFKGLEFGVAQRFFGGGKPKGFAALPDSPHQRSTSTEDKPPADEDPMDSNFDSEPVMVNNLQDQKKKDMSSNTSFDSFVRNRVVADAGDLSMENYQMTPTRDIAKLHSEQSPDSGFSTMGDSQAESAVSHYSLNKTADTLNEEDAGVLTSQLDASLDVSHPEEPERSTVPPSQEEQYEQLETHLRTDDKFLAESQLEEQEKVDSFLLDQNVEERSVGGTVSQEISQLVQDEQGSGEMIEEQILGPSFIAAEKKGEISHMDISVDTNVNKSVDMSHHNDTMSVYTTGTALTAYTQSSRTRRPGVAKTKLAKQKELERTSAKKPQGWHETIIAAAQSAKRTWDPEKGWVDYEEPEIIPTEIDNKKDKIRIALNRSVVSHKDINTTDTSDNRKEPAAQVPFPYEWEKEREAMIHANSEAVYPSQLPLSRNFDDETNGILYNDRNIDVYTRNVYEENTAVDVDYTNVESIQIDNEAKSIESDVYYDDVIVVEGDEEASRNVIEVVKQKVSEDDLELFPQAQRIDEVKKMNTAPADRDLHEIIPPSEMDRVNTSLVSLDPSNVSSRRGAGPVDTDEVDETWDSDDEDHQNATMNNSNSNQHNLVDLAEHHHIDGWRDSSNPVPQQDTTNQTTSGYDTSRSAGNLTNISATSSSKKIPKLQRSKRDTSPLSFRSPIEVAFPRSQESIQRHENFEVEYAQPITTIKADAPNVETAVSVPKASTSSPKEYVVATSHDDTNIVQARLKEWESRIEISHSSDNGDPVEKNRSQGLLPVATAGWRSFLGRKVQAEQTSTDVQISKSPHAKQLSEELPSTNDVGIMKQGTKVASTDDMFHFTENGESLALNLSDLSPIQVKDDVSDDDNASSVAYGPTDEQRKSSSFLERLTECAAPIMPTKASAFCGRPEVVVEAENIADVSQVSGSSSEKHRRSMSNGDEKPKSLASLRPTNDTIRVSTSSVVSEDFGAKTAFLDSLAMKAAVSKPKRSSSSSRRYEQSTTSSVVSGATDHSEKWKMFLERKKASDTGPIVTQGSGADVSRAAEKYAAEKVEEIMSKMAARSKTTPRHRESRNDLGDMSHLETNLAKELPSNNTNVASTGLQPHDNSVSAAEDLAAARVEAMMAALANANLDEGEI